MCELEVVLSIMPINQQIKIKQNNELIIADTVGYILQNYDINNKIVYNLFSVRNAEFIIISII